MSATTNTVTATSGALMLAMTDLFISATASLLVVLTLASPDRPTPLPVQADLVMLCPNPDAKKEEFALLLASAVAFGGQAQAGTLRPGTTIHAVSDHVELGQVMATIELPAKPMLTIALAPASDRPLTATCFATATRRLLSRYHYQSNDPHGVAVPTLGLQVIDRRIRHRDDTHE